MEKLLQNVSMTHGPAVATRASRGQALTFDRRTPPLLEPLLLEAAGLTDPGRRRLNEDQVLIADLGAARHRDGLAVRDDRRSDWLLVVADGMGGHPGGDVASLLAVRVLLSELVHTSPDVDNPVRRLEAAMRSCDREIHEAGARRTDLASMGTTLTAAWWVPPMLYFAHVGHSRLYLSRGGRLVRLTRDHTVSAGMTAAGFEETKAAGFEHVLTQVLGGDCEGVAPDAGCRRLQAGDALLLCSDGLLRGVDEDQITSTLESNQLAGDAAKSLLECALATDDHDNVTALVARIASYPAQGPR
jgi:protein phosphatase